MLTIDDTGISAVMKLSGGNPGSVRVCAELLRLPNGIMLLLDMDDMGMKGPSIWLGYKDFAGQNIETFAAALRSRDKEMIRVIKAGGGEAWSGGRS